MKFETPSSMDYNAETEGEGLGLEEGASPDVFPEGAVLVEKPNAFDFEMQSLSGALAEKLDMLSPEQYKAVVDEIFIPNQISIEIVEGISDKESNEVWQGVVAFVTAKNEQDKIEAKTRTLDFFGK